MVQMKLPSPPPHTRGQGDLHFGPPEKALESLGKGDFLSDDLAELVLVSP